MNMIWALLQNNRGTMSNLGSLSHYFSILEKTHLGGEHPDYHPLLWTLMQILNGLILNAWETECKSLEDYTKSKPHPDEILWSAHIILNKYAIPECKQMFGKPPKPTSSPNPSPKPDTVCASTVLLIQDFPLCHRTYQHNIRWWFWASWRCPPWPGLHVPWSWI